MGLSEFVMTRLNGEQQPLSAYDGKVLLVVNTASRCGFTPQYKDLQALYEKHQAEGFEILGFPCNQFGGQEPGSSHEIEEFCEQSFHVTFPMFEKIEVNGAGAHPLYRYLKEQAPGVMGSKAIKWNFTKFLVDRKGNVVGRYGPNVSPKNLASEIEKLLRAE